MNWEGLLVSVRDEAEANAALAGGAAIIDVKEPGHGSLGRAPVAVAAAVARAVGDRRPWTLACGELGGLAAVGRCAGDTAAEEIVRHVADVCAMGGAIGAAAPVPAAVKVGLAGAVATDWRRRLAGVFARLPPGSGPVAVAYADWERAVSPPPPEVVAAAAELGCVAVLIDTYDKQAAGLFGCCPAHLPATWVAAVRAAGLRAVVAGRLTEADVPAAWALGPDVVAVRSAVCSGGRTGVVQAARVHRLVGLGTGRPLVPARPPAWSHD